MGSTDETYEFIKSTYSDFIECHKIICKQFHGVSRHEARNYGLKHAKNDWIAYADQKCVFSHDFLQQFSNSISMHPESKTFYSQDESTIQKTYAIPFSVKSLYEKDFICITSYVHHASLVNELGGFSESQNGFAPERNFILKQCIKYEPMYVEGCFVHRMSFSECCAMHASRKANLCLNAIPDISYDACGASSHACKSVVYTCIVNEYDTLRIPLTVSHGIDFILFTDNPSKYEKQDFWKVRPIPLELCNLSPIKMQRALKICPHRYLREYSISIWVDGNIQIKDDLNKFIQMYDLTRTSLYVRKHPQRNCIYDEAEECIRQKKDSSDVINAQMQMLLSQNYPKNNGLAETGIILRDHRNAKCQQLCELWIQTVLEGSHRDQLSFNYACWKTGFECGILDKQSSIVKGNDIFFEWLVTHSSKEKKYDTSFVTIAICNFNTTFLTNNCIYSIYQHCKDFKFKFVILDNSDQMPFELDRTVKQIISRTASVEVLDNTKQQLISFDQMMKKSPHRLMPFNANNFGSVKHAYSIQFLLDRCESKFMLLFDSDISLLRDIDFIDDRFASIADVEEHGKLGRNGKMYSSFSRALPFIQFFNVKMLDSKNIKYFDYNRIHGILAPNRGNYYDTGSSFYLDLIKNKLPFKRIDHHSYILHLDHGSWYNEFVHEHTTEKPGNAEDLTIVVSTDNKTFPFTLPFMYFASKYNMKCTFDLHLFSGCDVSQIEDGIQFLQSIFECKVNVHDNISFDVTPYAYRFLVDPINKTKYAYCCDIDIMICECIMPFHLRRLQHGKWCYDNEVRAYADASKMSGLHFCTQDWYDKTRQARDEYLKNGVHSNSGMNNCETILKEIADKSYVQLRPLLKTASEFSRLRPVHGQHMSMSRVPFNQSSTMKVVLDSKYEKPFIETIQEDGFKRLMSLSPQNTHDIFNTYLSFVNCDFQF